jgi:DNA-binding GntR family transcriptional regulator
MKFVPSSRTDFKVPREAAVLRHSVTESIRNVILLGHFLPGERLPERELCEMTGVSRTLVREALRQLESERLIRVIPHRGPIVETVSVEQADGIYRVREELEGLASELFAERASDEQLMALQTAYENIKRSMSVKDPLVQLDAKNNFYKCLLDGAGNEALFNTLKLLNSQVMLLRSVSMQVPGRSAQSLKELGVLMDALAVRDCKAARKAGSRHVRHAAAAALKLMRESQPVIT